MAKSKLHSTSPLTLALSREVRGDKPQGPWDCGKLSSMNSRPNFIFILADDLGSADLGCYGDAGASFDVSPNIDGMARDGMRFTHAMANSPVCSPTRFALMTGRYQYRFRGAAEEPMGGNARGSSVLGLPPIGSSAAPRKRY